VKDFLIPLHNTEKYLVFKKKTEYYDFPPKRLESMEEAWEKRIHTFDFPPLKITLFPSGESWY